MELYGSRPSSQNTLWKPIVIYVNAILILQPYFNKANFV